MNRYRQDFPTLSKKVHDHDLVYLDNAATTLKPQAVIDGLLKYYIDQTANVHRGIHTLSELSTNDFEKTRELTKEFINAKYEDEIIFTTGTTGSINTLSHIFENTIVKKDDEIIISEMEHHSNIVPWQILANKVGAHIKVIPMTQKGELLIDEYEKLLNDKTKVVAVNHISNALGTINPIERIIELAHKHNAVTVIDGAQSVAHTKVDMQKLDTDFFVFSGHKMFGPTGVGVLYGKKDLLNSLPPFLGGGAMIDQVSFKETTYLDAPHRFEAGTPHIAGVMALGNAIEYINKLDFDEMIKYEDELLSYATSKLKTLPGFKVIGEADTKASVLSFIIDGIHPQDIASFVDKKGIALRTGHHCAQPIMEKMGVTATCRASFSFYNTKEEVDKLYDALKTTIELFKD